MKFDQVKEQAKYCSNNHKPVEIVISEIIDKDNTLREVLYCPKCRMTIVDKS